MRKIVNLHIHSKYSRACSRDLVLENIEKWCEYKGIDMVSTGDFTHPAWFSEIQKKLEEGRLSLQDVIEQVKSMGQLGGFEKIKSMIPGFSSSKIP